MTGIYCNNPQDAPKYTQSANLHQAHGISRHFLSTYVDHRRSSDFLAVGKGIRRGRQILHEIRTIVGALGTKSGGQALENATLAKKHFDQS